MWLIEYVHYFFSCINITYPNLFLFVKNVWKLWYLIAICFVIGEGLFDYATEMQLWLSSNTLQKNSGFGRWISNLNDVFFIITINGITSRIDWLNVIYCTCVVLKAISVCNLLYHNTGHSTYVITYPVHDIEFSVLLASSWYQPPANSASTLHSMYFFFIRSVNYAVCR